MEVRDIETYVVGTPEPHKGGSNWVFVKLTTDDGTVGWGECNWARYRSETLATALEELGETFVIGRDPHDVESIREDLYHRTHFLHVPGPVHANVIAAFEMACLDIVGKANGEPIYDMLGGQVHDELRTYTYIHYEWNPPESPEAAAEAAEGYVEMGFTGLKVDPLQPVAGPRTVSGEEMDYGAAVIAAIREAVSNTCDILVGTHGQLHTQEAVRFARRIEEYDPLWLEEPVSPERVDEMATVAEKTTIPVATGERITTKHAAADVVERDAASILQPNVGMLGIIGAKEAAGHAESHYTQIAPWMYCGPVAGAANVQVDACSRNFLIQESIEDWSWFHNSLLEDGIDWEDGYITPPSDPGLGVTPVEEELEKHPKNDVPHPDERGTYARNEFGGRYGRRRE
jgi:2-dehydro-3-deoxyphosphogalactonate aldolase